MFKSIFKIIKKIIVSIFVLYGYNIVTNKFNLNIPINIYTVGIISIFDTPGFLGLMLFYVLNFR